MFQNSIISILIILIFTTCKIEPKDPPKTLPTKIPTGTKDISYTDAMMLLIDTTCYTGIQVLELEDYLGMKANIAEYNFIDNILNDLAPKIPQKTTYSKREALQILKTIHQEIWKYNKDLLSYNSSFSMCLRYQIFDCDIMSLLYLTIADHFKLPLHPIYMPNHLLVLWEDDQNKIYWETTEGKIKSQKFYLNKIKFKKSQIGEGLILKKLNRKQITALVHYNIALAQANKGYYTKSYKLLFQALEIAPEWLAPYRLLGKLYQSDKRYHHAEAAYLEGLEIVPDLHLIKKELEDLYKLIGCKAEAKALWD